MSLDNDGFTLIKYKHPRHYQSENKNKYHQIPKQDHADSEQHLENITKYIENCKLEIKTSSFYKELQNIMIEHLSQKTKKEQELFQEIICYGIGQLSETPIARYQFALLLLLWQHFMPSGQCSIYDPVFTYLDKQIINHFNLNLINENEEAKRKVTQKTLFYMPHCGKPMYNNILWANWGLMLTNVVIIGNSFHSYEEKIPSHQLFLEAPYISQMLPLTEEVKLPTKFHHGDVFNDLSIHFFKDKKIRQQEHFFWKDCKDPVYEGNVEIILRSSF